MDETELREIVERHAPSVYRLAYARTGRHADAEDVMQEVFLRLVRARPEFRDEGHCKAWLLRVTANCAVSLFRSPWKSRTEPLNENLPAEEPELEPDLAEVVDAVLRLPEKYRAAVHLFYYEQMSVKEIGLTLGKSEQAVKTVLFRARGLLRETLKGVFDNA